MIQLNNILNIFFVMSNNTSCKNKSSLSDKDPTNKKDIDTDIDFNEIKKNIPSDFDTWTECKKQAWQHLDDNPNTFFYRHVLPGEKKKNGAWSEDEKVLFLKVLKEHPPIKGHWGLFSRYIPSRVGYQCNAFYKRLVSSGEIEEIVTINKKTNNNTNNNNVINNNSNINNNTQEISIKNTDKPQTNLKKKVVVLKSSSSSRLQSIISFLYLPHKSSMFDDYDISLINRRPPHNTTSANKIVFDGSEYAYNNTLITQKDDFIINSDLKLNPPFHEQLVEELKDPAIEAKFENFSYEYFKFS